MMALPRFERISEPPIVADRLFRSKIASRPRIILPVTLNPLALFSKVLVPVLRFQIVRFAMALLVTLFVTVNEEAAARLLVISAFVVAPGTPFRQLGSVQLPPMLLVQLESTACSRE